jgi:hypothetical protein
MKRVGDHSAVGERERGPELSVDLGDQGGLRRGCGAVELGQPRERPLVSRGRESKRHAPFSRYRRRWVCLAVSVGSSAEVSRFCFREGDLGIGGNHVLSFRPHGWCVSIWFQRAQSAASRTRRCCLAKLPDHAQCE